MLRKLGIAGTIVALLTGAWLSFAGDGDDPEGATEQVLSLKMKELGESSVPLAQDHLVIKQADGQRNEIPVALSRTTYDATIRTTMRGLTKDWSGILAFYELRSTDPAVSFTWTLCTSWPVQRVFLLTDDSGETSYFALTDASKAFFIEILKARDDAAALADFFLIRDWNQGVHVPVIKILDTLPFLTRDATKGPDISIASIGRSKSGWVVRVYGPNSDRIFTLVGDGATWHTE